MDQGIDAVILWSTWPETYSFTVHESFAANCLVLTNKDSGNIAAKITGTSRGVVCDNEETLFTVLYDVSLVKTLILKNYEQNSPHILKFNPAISLETANTLTGEKSDKCSQQDQISLKIKFDKAYVAQAFCISCTTGDHIVKQAKRIEAFKNEQQALYMRIRKHKGQIAELRPARFLKRWACGLLDRLKS